MSIENRGGKRKGAGRKSAPYETKTVSFRLRPEYIPEIKELVKKRVEELNLLHGNNE